MLGKLLLSYPTEQPFKPGFLTPRDCRLIKFNLIFFLTALFVVSTVQTIRSHRNTLGGFPTTINLFTQKSRYHFWVSGFIHLRLKNITEHIRKAIRQLVQHHVIIGIAGIRRRAGAWRCFLNGLLRLVAIGPPSADTCPANAGINA